MARKHFSEYPYINFSDFNFDWVLKTVRKLVEDWKSYNETWDNWQEGIETDFADLKTYVINYFENLDIEEEVRKQVNEKLAELLTDEFIMGYLNKYINETPRTINGSVVVDTIQNDNYFMQGGCYVGDNRVVVYFSKNDSDIGLLDCYDLEQKTKIWSYPIKAYHGGSIAFYNNELYIAGTFSVDNPDVLIPTITVVNLNSPDSIDRVITPSVPSILTCVYGDNKFYCLTDRGTEAGVCNKVTVFDTNFNYLSEFLLEEYPSLYGNSTQGNQCYYNGIIYTLDYRDRAVCGNDVNTGERVYYAYFNEYFNGYRSCGEPEFLTYDDINNKFYMGNQLGNTGQDGYRFGGINKVGLYKNVTEKIIRPLGWVSASGTTVTGRANVHFETKNNTPATNANFKNVADAVGLSKCGGYALNVVMYFDENDFNGLYLILRDFTGSIVSSRSTPHLPIINILTEGCNVVFQHLDFKGNSTNENYWGTYAGAGLFINSDIQITDCTSTEDTTIKAIFSTIKESGTSGMYYDLTKSEIKRTTHNLQYKAKLDNHSKLIGRIWAGSVASGNEYQTTVLGQNFLTMYLNSNLKALLSSNGLKEMNISFDGNNNLILTSDNTNLTLTIDTTTGVMTSNNSANIIIDLT